MKKRPRNNINMMENKKCYILLLIYILIIVISTIFVACKSNSESQLKNYTLNNKQTYENTINEISNDVHPKTSKGISSINNMDEIMTQSIVEKFCDDMAKSWLKLERVDMSNYLVDNLDTHLTLRWIDFDIADRLQNTWKQLISVDNIVLSNVTFKKISEKEIIYNAFSDISYTRHESSVNGIGIRLKIVLEMIEGKWMITSTETIAASIYNKWKEKHCTTIKEMDQVFLNSCKEHGLSINAHNLLTSSTKNSKAISLDELPNTYNLADAKSDNYVVFENGDITNGQSA